LEQLPFQIGVNGPVWFGEVSNRLLLGVS